MHHESPIQRRKTRQIHVGKVAIGGDAPISVQSMTNTETRDVAATVAQIRRLEAVGADIVRVSVPSMDAAEAFKAIRAQVETPLVADIHFDHRIALQVMADGVDGLRINPGNIGSLDKTRLVVEMAKDKGIPIRIGVNAGSLEKDIQEKYGEPTPEALVESALRHVSILDELNFHDVKISVEEIRVGFDILKSLHLRQKGINLIACPSCSRQEFDVINTINALEARLEDILEPMDVSVIGCVVNGIGEAKEADIGLAGGDKRSILYYRGKQVDRVENVNIVDVLEKRIRAEIAERQAARNDA